MADFRPISEASPSFPASGPGKKVQWTAFGAAQTVSAAGDRWSGARSLLWRRIGFPLEARCALLRSKKWNQRWAVQNPSDWL